MRPSATWPGWLPTRSTARVSGRLAEALDVPGGISLDVFVPALVEVALADAFATARVCTQLPAALQERDRDDLAEVVRRAAANRVGRYDRSEWLVESRA